MENFHEEIPYDMLVMARRKLSAKDRFFLKLYRKNGIHYITTFNCDTGRMKDTFT